MSSRRWACPLDASSARHAAQVFDKYATTTAASGTGGSGAGAGPAALPPRQLKLALMACQGFAPTDFEVDRAAARGGAGGVALPQFVELLEAKARMEPHGEGSRSRAAFGLLDGGHKGFLTLSDLHAAVALVAPGLPAATAAVAFREADGDDDRRVSLREFERVAADCR